MNTILGDFNYPSINWNTLTSTRSSEHHSSKFLSITQDFFLYQHVDFPTHQRPNQNPTLIDLVFSTNDQCTSNLTKDVSSSWKLFINTIS